MRTVRLIELFSGIGAQAAALSRTQIPYELYKTSEWNTYAVASYKAIHCPNDNNDYSKCLSDAKVVEQLEQWGVSTDGKTPLQRKQIERKGADWCREVYNNFKATNNIGSIVNIHGQDLGIKKSDKYIHILTYSFPCQALSLAGKRKGMKKGSGTSSGLLWEVERVLQECKHKPEILLMENVTQVHNKKNMADFNIWLQSLEQMGYFNYWDDLNAKDYGIPQNRDRCFMISLQNPTLFRFPTPIPLEYTLKDFMDEKVDEKYYVNSEKATSLLQKLREDGKLT